ncbi:Uu.00g064050.m01.CDS01 [Anthostomella pinea]|uniref:Uu.00g064050.m01.CDS01 n=1 Tax=Anthostomella pinea TaxID=933095 RepID=A0AAI8VU41_9PEZI|nr:Uu.00g064050.m01.CDS01 [Anthostomella pinea]
MAPLKSNSKAREPPPSLFLHPSPAGSHVSLSSLVAASGALPSGPGPRSNSQIPSGGASTQPSQAPPSLARTGSLLNPRNRGTTPRLQTADSTRTADRTDALWAEMQATLEEVELSASGGTRVFGSEHDRKLAELRAAQIALAQAWARSEADDSGDATSPETEVRNLKGALGEVGGIAVAVAAGAALGATIPTGGGRGVADGTDGGKSTIGTGSLPPGASGLGGERLGAKLEEETERDILLARNRREANDRYFSKVDQGVKDVVAKLEEVATAMRAVEQETRDVWGDESVPGSAKA